MPHREMPRPLAARCDALDVASDRSLLLEVREGNDAAAERIYHLYAQRLLAVARKQSAKELANRFDPDDVVQSVFASFFRDLRDGLYDIPPDGKLWPLLLVIAINQVRAFGAYHRAARRNVRREVSCADGVGEFPPVNQFEFTEAHALVRLITQEVLQQLPEHHRQVMLWRLEGFDLDEIASMSGRSRRSIERDLHECRSIFQEHL